MQNIKTTKLSEMSMTTSLNNQDKFPLIKQGFNRNISTSDLKDAIGTPVSDSIVTESSEFAASSTAAKTLNDKITQLNQELAEFQSKIQNEVDDLQFELSNLNINWNQIEDIPEIIGERGERGFPGADGINGIDGKDGKDGRDGIDGKDGEDGKDGKDGIDGQPGVNGSYMHIKYSINPNGNPMSDTPKDYIGLLVSEDRIAPSDYKLYKWSKFTSSDGENGIPGPPGEDGRTQYLHIKYGIGYENNVMVFTDNNGETPGDWLGQYVDFTELDSSDPNKYNWTKIKGQDGKDGIDGIDGVPGEPGLTGPVVVFLGEYDNNTEYAGTNYTRNVVKFFDGNRELYYITRIGVGIFKGIPTSNSLYWDTFEGNFRSIATELLVAEGANIAGWQFYTTVEGDQVLKSQSNNTILNGSTGEISAADGKFKVNRDGSGHLAWGDIEWDKDGNIFMIGGDYTNGSEIHIGDKEPLHNGQWRYGKLGKDSIKFFGGSVNGASAETTIKSGGIAFNAGATQFSVSKGAVTSKADGSRADVLSVKLASLPDKRIHKIEFNGWNGYQPGTLYIDGDGSLKVSDENTQSNIN